jgi:hypothetical protein
MYLNTTKSIEQIPYMDLVCTIFLCLVKFATHDGERIIKLTLYMFSIGLNLLQLITEKYFLKHHIHINYNRTLIFKIILRMGDFRKSIFGTIGHEKI